MANRPLAEIDVTEELVGHVLAEQHPDLAALPLGRRLEGWDCVTVRLGTSLAVRLPRRAAADLPVRREQEWLPRLAERLAVPLPVPVRRGQPSEAFPWHWSVVPWLDGETAASVPASSRTSWAPTLADVVTDLHRPAEAGAPKNAVRGVPLASRDDAVRDRIRSGAVPQASQVLALWDRALRSPTWSGPPLWLHGDLHPANLLVHAERLVGLLDFVDLTAGDPATDLATAWLTFDERGRRVFRQRVATRCDTDPPTWQRAHGWAIVLATAILAGSDDDPQLQELGRHALTQVLADPP